MENNKSSLTRKEAIKKMGKYAAITALGTYAILNPLKAQQTSPPDPGGDPLGRGGPFDTNNGNGNGGGRGRGNGGGQGRGRGRNQNRG